MTTLKNILEGDDPPLGLLPSAPPWHVESLACLHGWIRGGTPTEWITCDCEDPANPWPARNLGDGPRDCACFHCEGHIPRWERGCLAQCEYKDHHCDDCHAHQRCTITMCGFGS